MTFVDDWRTKGVKKWILIHALLYGVNKELMLSISTISSINAGAFKRGKEILYR
jgi:hypothetical protein